MVLEGIRMVVFMVGGCGCVSTGDGSGQARLSGELVNTGKGVGGSSFGEGKNGGDGGGRGGM